MIRLKEFVYLVGHHHTYTNVDGIDYQILLEADFLVNIENTKENIFKTKTDISLIANMYLKNR